MPCVIAPADKLLRAGDMPCCTPAGQCPPCVGDPRAGCRAERQKMNEHENCLMGVSSGTHSWSVD